MKSLASLCCLALAAAPAVAVPPKRAPRSELNSKHHLLRVQIGSVLGGVYSLTSAMSDELTRLAVGADITVSVPSFIGSGHGPFLPVYAEQALEMRAGDGLTITKTDEREEFVVRCMRAGVFEIAIDFIGLDGKPKADTIDVGCIAPTRFTATVVPFDSDANATQYLAGASQVRAALVWYGRRDGGEVPLLGELPVEVPDKSPLEIVAQGADLRLGALRPAKSATIISVGQRVTLPIEIVEPKTFTVDVSVTTKKFMVSIRTRVLDAKGQPFAGLAKCELTSVTGAVETPRGRCGMATSVRKLQEWKADQVCATVLGKRACTTP